MADKRPRSHGATVELKSARESIKILHISDTHKVLYKDLPSADILIHSGDFLNDGISRGFDDIIAFGKYFVSLPYKLKILVPGNHELGCDKIPKEEFVALVNPTGDKNIVVLIDAGLEYMGIKFYGTPWTYSGGSWGVKNPDERGRHYSRIPDDTDVLITHQPPHKILDLAWESDGCYRPWGCPILRDTVLGKRIPIHCFGHVHDDVGIVQQDGTTFSNAAIDIFKRPNMIHIVPPAAQ